jgi:O-antigen ligase
MHSLTEKRVASTISLTEGSKVLFALFLLYLLSWYLQVSARKEFFQLIRFEFVLGFFLLIGSLLAVRPKHFTRSGLAPYIALYSLAVIIQIPLSFNIGYSYEIFIQKFFKLAAIAWFIFVFVRTPKELKIFTAVLLLAFFKITSEGFIGFLDESMLWFNQGIMRLHGSTPLWSHPNSLAGLSIGAIPFILTLYPVVSSRLAKAGLIVLALTSMVCMVFSGSRTGYVAFLGLLLFYLWGHSAAKRWRALLLAAVLLVGLAITVPQGYRDRFDSIFTEQDQFGQSISLRKQILEDAWQVFGENPFGIGVGAFPLVRGEMFGRLQDTHNIYLEAATNLGIQGLLLFLLLLWHVGRVLRQTRRGFAAAIDGWVPAAAGGEGEVLRDLRFCHALCSGCLLFLAVHLCLGLFGHNLYEIQWWLLIGMALVLRRILLDVDRQKGSSAYLSQESRANE